VSANLLDSIGHPRFIEPNGKQRKVISDEITFGQTMKIAAEKANLTLI